MSSATCALFLPSFFEVKKKIPTILSKQRKRQEVERK